MCSESHRTRLGALAAIPTVTMVSGVAQLVIFIGRQADPSTAVATFPKQSDQVHHPIQDGCEPSVVASNVDLEHVLASDILLRLMKTENKSRLLL